jgi:acyl-CoA synthetase (AMP-forming)/AMP-acid ligase II
VTVPDHVRQFTEQLGMDMSEQPEEVVDLDLKAEDTRLREAVGKATTVKIDDVVIHIVHAAEWSSTAMKAAMNGDWASWADEVIVDEEECQAFIDADLMNYQLEAIFELCGKAANTKPGKSRRSRRL